MQNEAQYIQILREYGPAVRAFIRSIIPQREDAEEVAQDTFVKAFGHLTAYDASRSPMKNWLLGIAYNETRMYFRKRQAAVVCLEDDERLVNTVSDDEADRLLAETRERRIEALTDAIRRLKPEDQMLLHLYYTEGLPLKEIAGSIGHDHLYLATRLQRIRKKLCVMIKTIEDNGEE